MPDNPANYSDAKLAARLPIGGLRRAGRCTRILSEPHLGSRQRS